MFPGGLVLLRTQDAPASCSRRCRRERSCENEGTQRGGGQAESKQVTWDPGQRGSRPARTGRSLQAEAGPGSVQRLPHSACDHGNRAEAGGRGARSGVPLHAAGPRLGAVISTTSCCRELLREETDREVLRLKARGDRNTHQQTFREHVSHGEYLIKESTGGFF